MNGNVSAPGKAILLGEHAVVYGRPAIAVPLTQLRARAEYRHTESALTIIAADLERPPWRWQLNVHDTSDPLAAIARLAAQHLRIYKPRGEIRLRSDIPIASGLGSGAAVSAALGRAIAALHSAALPDAALNDMVFEVEKLHHGTPSGIDNTTVVYERSVFFQHGKPLTTLKLAQPLHFLIADTGLRALTRESVAAVRQLHRAQPTSTRRIFDEIARAVMGASNCLENGDLPQLGELMTRNHGLLVELGLSSPQLDNLVAAAVAAGACGAKLSGGGRGGNVIALVEPSALPAVKLALERAGCVRLYETRMGGG